VELRVPQLLIDRLRVPSLEQPKVRPGMRVNIRKRARISPLKGDNISAQGFNPGYTPRSKNAP
jgi:hypothetical protein